MRFLLALLPFPFVLAAAPNDAFLEDPRLALPGPILEWHNERPPNIVFILSDDQGWNQVGYLGSDYYETPNIDRIALEGIIFTQAYASASICSPTRAALMTGRAPARLGITIPLSIGRDRYIHPVLEAPQPIALPLEETTIPEMLTTIGYTSGHFGKWHLGLDKNYRPGRVFDPESQGFDTVFTSKKPDRDDPPEDAHHAGEITDHAIRFIEDNRDHPFFCYISHHVVHRPLIESSELVARYERKKGSTEDPVKEPVMGAMIERMDREIGRVLDTLNRLGLADNTIVVFMSDNGGFEELQDQAPLRGGKGNLYEGGIRVPLCIRWPGVIEPGRVCDVPVITHDFFPTFMRIVGLPYVPDRLDGVDISPILRDQVETLDREALYWHLPNYHDPVIGPQSAIRWGDWKLIVNLENEALGSSGAFELYNLARDLGEETDLADEMPRLVVTLNAMRLDWLAEVGADEVIIRKDWPPYDMIDDPVPPPLPPLPTNRTMVEIPKG